MATVNGTNGTAGVDYAKVTAALDKLGQMNPGRAAALTKQLKANPESLLKVYADANRDLTSITRTSGSGVVGANRFDASLAIARKFLAIGQAGAQEDEGRVAHYRVIEQGLSTLGVA